jgi:hypothetical protein
MNTAGQINSGKSLASSGINTINEWAKAGSTASPYNKRVAGTRVIWFVLKPIALFEHL